MIGFFITAILTTPRTPLWVCGSEAGVSTISILVFAGDAGFITKPSVRHGDDPFGRKQNRQVGRSGAVTSSTLNPKCFLKSKDC